MKEELATSHYHQDASSLVYEAQRLLRNAVTAPQPPSLHFFGMILRKQIDTDLRISQSSNNEMMSWVGCPIGRVGEVCTWGLHHEKLM